MIYTSKVPSLIKQFYSGFLWEEAPEQKTIYLTFDDGPTPDVTGWVLKNLATYDASATFFMIGQHVKAYPALAHKVIDSGHTVGNHSYSHPDGWKTSTFLYLRNFLKAQRTIQEFTGYRTHLFRPPYGKITLRQADFIMRTHQIVMLDVLAGDFDTNLSPEKCLKNVLNYTHAGSIVCLHDSVKAWPRLNYVLPRVLEHFAEQGYQFRRLNPNPLR